MGSGMMKEARPAHTIPERSRQAAIGDLVDLGRHYNASLDDDWLALPGANLSSLPKGVQAFARAAFDVRGLIQLAGGPRGWRRALASRAALTEYR